MNLVFWNNVSAFGPADPNAHFPIFTSSSFLDTSAQWWLTFIEHWNTEESLCTLPQVFFSTYRTSTSQSLPSLASNPNGKLRVLYECMPMAYIIEQAGGIASTGLWVQTRNYSNQPKDTWHISAFHRKPILDITPKKLHERSPIFLGSRDDVNDVLELIKKNREAWILVDRKSV